MSMPEIVVMLLHCLKTNYNINSMPKSFVIAWLTCGIYYVGVVHIACECASSPLSIISIARILKYLHLSDPCS